MQTPYEIAAKSVIPAIRGIISRSLIEKHMTQAEIARALGITQPAVSKYFSEKRGRAIDFDDHEEVKRMAEVVALGIVSHSMDDIHVANMIKEICDYVMRSGYMCELHYEIDPKSKEMNCTMCMDSSEIH
ncbi:MAG TPA: helix-turn-helix domain-containing protein [Nitrososphaerales archaeon]|nr:helix-turn-helix domain-containing protein [Nitrososphaerales archaeon]